MAHASAQPHLRLQGINLFEPVRDRQHVHKTPSPTNYFILGSIEVRRRTLHRNNGESHGKERGKNWKLGFKQGLPSLYSGWNHYQ